MEERSVDLGRRTAQAAGWSLLYKVIWQVKSLAVSIILARCLGPSAYGLVGMGLIVIGFVQLFRELGIGPAIVQHPEPDEEHLDSAFWGSVGAGFLLCLIASAFSPALAYFYREPKVMAIGIVGALGLITNAIPSVHLALLRRDLRFREQALVELAGDVLAGGVSIGMALTGWGVWSLLAGNLISPLITAACVWRLTHWQPRFRFRRKKLRELLNFGTLFTGSKILQYFQRNVDYMLIGRCLGAVPLGIYALAFKLMRYPDSFYTTPLVVPFYNAILTIRDDNARVRVAYLKITYVIAAMVMPIMAGMFVVAPDLVTVLYSPKWTDAIPLVKAFCLGSILRAMGETWGPIMYVKERPGLRVQMDLLALGLTVPAFLFAIRYGAWGIAVATSLVYVPIFLAFQSVVNRLLHLSWREYVWNLRFPVLGSLGMAMILGMLQKGMGLVGPVSPILGLLILVPGGVLLYGGALWWADRPFLREIKRRFGGR